MVKNWVTGGSMKRPMPLSSQACCQACEWPVRLRNMVRTELAESQGMVRLRPGNVPT